MNSNDGAKDTQEPDKFKQHGDVTDLRIGFGRFDERLQNLEKNMLTKEQFAASKLETVKWLFQSLLPLLTAILGFGLAYYLRLPPSS